MTKLTIKKYRLLGWIMLLLAVQTESRSAPLEENQLQGDEPYVSRALVPYLLQKQLETQLEGLLQASLAPYFDAHSFFVSVRLEQFTPKNLPPAETAPEPDPTPDEPLRGFIRLPALPKLDASRSSASDLLSFTLPTPENPQRRMLDVLSGPPRISQVGAELKSIQVRYILDPVIDRNTESLIRKITGYVMSSAGNQVPVEVLVERLPLINLLPETNSPEQLMALRMNMQQETKGDQLFTTDWPDISTWELYPWVYTLLAALLVFFLLLFLKWSRSGKKARKSRASLEGEPTGLGSGGKFTVELPEPVSPEQHSTTYYGIFQEYFIKKTNETAAVFSYWLEYQEEGGLRKVHGLLAPLGKNVYVMISPYLSGKAKAKLELSTHRLKEDTDEHLREKYARELVEMIDAEIGIDRFAFLKGLTETELFELLDTLKSRKLAVTLTHLPKEARKSYLARVRASEASEVFSLLQQPAILSEDELEALGAELSEFLHQIRRKNQAKTDHLPFLIESFPMLDVDNQEKLLTAWQESNPTLYELMRETVITWRDIPTLSPTIVRDAILTISSEELGIAYVGRPDEVALLIAQRPKREQKMIYDIAKMKKDLREENIKPVLQKILTVLQKTLKRHEYQSN